jgi:hypothetical protein
MEARGGDRVMLDQSARDALLVIKSLGDEICGELKKILDEEP